MIKTHRINNPKKAHNTVSDKRGFTLVELTVVMALVAILMVMIVSFSTMMGDFAGAEESEYAFLEDVSALKETLSDWVAENDVEGNVFYVQNDYHGIGFMNLVKTTRADVSFGGGTLETDTQVLRAGLDEIESISFKIPDAGSLVKCTVTGTAGGSVDFVIALRSAEIQR